MVMSADDTNTNHTVGSRLFGQRTIQTRNIDGCVLCVVIREGTRCYGLVDIDTQQPAGVAMMTPTGCVSLAGNVHIKRQGISWHSLALLFREALEP